MEEISESFCHSLREQLCGIYRTADRIAEYLVERERRSRLYHDDRVSVVDVRVEPGETQVFIYYTLVDNGKVRCREKIPMLWELFRRITETDTAKDRVKNPFSMEITKFNPYPKYPPMEKIRPLVREVTPEEACEILKAQARALNDGEYPETK